MEERVSQKDAFFFYGQAEPRAIDRFFYCAPGMGDNYRVEDPNTLGSRKC